MLYNSCGGTHAKPEAGEMSLLSLPSRGYGFLLSLNWNGDVRHDLTASETCSYGTGGGLGREN